MRRAALPLLLIAILAAGSGAAPAWRGLVPHWPIAAAQDFRPLPFHDLAERVTDRYAGRLIGAQIRHPAPQERDLGVALVYEFRLMTRGRHLLKIRLDARTGRFLEVAGRGQLQALKGNPENGNKDGE